MSDIVPPWTRGDFRGVGQAGRSREETAAPPRDNPPFDQVLLLVTTVTYFDGQQVDVPIRRARAGGHPVPALPSWESKQPGFPLSRE